MGLLQSLHQWSISLKKLKVIFFLKQRTFGLFKLTKSFCVYLERSINIDKNNEHQLATLKQLFKIRKIIRNQSCNEGYHHIDRKSNIKIVKGNFFILTKLDERIHLSVSGNITGVIVRKLVSCALGGC